MTSKASRDSQVLKELQAKVFAADLRVCDLMTRDVYSLSEDKSLLEASQAMQRLGIHHIPLVDESNRLMGLLSHRDLLSFSLSEKYNPSASLKSEELRKILIREAMKDIRTSQVESVDPELSLRSAAIRMRDYSIGCLPVTNTSGELVGILTEKDFLRFFADGI